MKRILGALALLVSLLVSLCPAQLTIQVQNAGTPLTTAKKWLAVNCSTGMTCTFTNGVIVMTASGGAGSGTVTSVLGTANQIASDGSTTTPTLSIPSTFIFPGTAAGTSLALTDTAANSDLTATNTTAAVVGTSQGSPLINLCGKGFHGSASVNDCLTLGELPGNGNDAAIIFTLDHTGTSTGTWQFKINSGGTQTTPALRIGTSASGWYWGVNAGAWILAASSGTADNVAFTGNASQIGLLSSGKITFGSSTTALNAGNMNSDTTIGRLAAGILEIGNSTTVNRNGFLLTGNSVRVASDFTTSGVGTALENITGLTWTFPAVAANYNYHCHLGYSQAVGTAAVAFGIKATTNNPTNIYSTGEMYTAAGTVITGVLATLATTTATNIVTGTPNATGVNEPVDLYGTMELPASAVTINIMTSTATAADLVTVLRGSYCSLTP